MMQNLLQLGLSLSVICNCLSMWWLGRLIFSRDKHLQALTDLVMAMMQKKLKASHPNVIPINLKKP